MPWFEESCECEWVVCKLYTPPISIIGLKPLRLVGIVPAAGLAQGIGRAGAVLWVQGTGRAEVPAGIDLAEAVLSAPGIGRVRGTARPWAGRGTGPADIGRLGAGPSYGCS